MKYVMFESELGRRFPVIFADNLVHAVVANFVRNMSTRFHKEDCKPISAGFISLGDDVSTFGESESLGGMKTREVDALRIMAGESVSHMPDVLLAPLMDKLKGRVHLPQSIDEAKGMLLVAEAYLKEHTPENLKR